MCWRRGSHFPSGAKSLVGNRGYRRYIKVDGKAFTIDREALKKEERYDGKYLLLTNSKLSVDQVALAYKDLWKVERAFREMKSGLDLRPVYHWTDSRVRGHVMVCFLALVMETALQRKLWEADPKLKYRQVLQDTGIQENVSTGLRRSVMGLCLVNFMPQGR